jgi:predicted ATPase/DNA-binding SARP family transcriptional activator
MADSSSIKLYLLGAPRLERDGAPAPIERRKAVALLAYLALTEQSHLRDALATLLWPDSGQTPARANLRHTLVMLKQALGDDTLDIAWESVAIKPEATLWVDVLHFQRLLAGGQTHGHAPGAVCAACLPLLIEAVTLPAEHFMAGFSLTDSPEFDDWQRAQQHQLTQALSDALDRLVRHLAQTGETKRAIDYAQRRLALDTLDEAAHRQLMQLYAGSGQQGLALRQFEQCAAILGQELGVAPSAETARLGQEIRDGRAPAPAASAVERITVAPPQAAAPVWQPAETPRHNLPMRLPTLLGREGDLRAIQSLLQRPDVNLVTLIGPGGVGKTSLALQIGQTILDSMATSNEHPKSKIQNPRFEDGVFFISLAPLHEPDLVIAAVAQTWALQTNSRQSPLESVKTYLHHKQTLLVLDNFEHVISAAPLLSELLADCARLKILVTSREVLHVQGEHVYPTPPLALPVGEQVSALERLAEVAAIQLFVQRGQAVKPAFALDEQNAAAVGEICRRLDGLPLAIELAAARINLLTPQTLLQRLTDASSIFQLLQGGRRDAPRRQRTLRLAIAWSYHLLTESEQRLFRWLAIFWGGCTLSGVEELDELVGRSIDEPHNPPVLDLLASLVNKSLVQQSVQPDGEPRFSLLETVREYALDELRTSGERPILARSHAECCIHFAERAEHGLLGADHLRWLARFNVEHENCRAALRWAISAGDGDLALRLGGALWDYWFDRGYYHEGRALLVSILQLADAQPATARRAKVLTGLGALAWMQGDTAAARTSLDEAVRIYRTLADEQGVATALKYLGMTTTLDCDLILARKCYDESLALYQKTNDPLGVATVQLLIGIVEYESLNYHNAGELFTQSVAVFRARSYEAGLGAGLLHLARVSFQQGDFATARRLFSEGLQKAQARGDQWLVAYGLYFLGRVAYHQGDYAVARLWFEQSLCISRELGLSTANLTFPLAFLGDIACAEGDYRTARALLSESITIGRKGDHPYSVAIALACLAGLAVAQGEAEQAVRLTAAAVATYHLVRSSFTPTEQGLFDFPLKVARPLLSEAQFEQAWATGSAMTMDEAIAFAIADAL